MLPPKLDSAEALSHHLAALIRRDARLAAIATAVGPLQPRLRQSGFAGLAHIVTGQQLSVASAAAIWARFSALPGALEPTGFLALSDDAIRGAGFSWSRL